MSRQEIMKQNLLTKINDYYDHLLYIKDVIAVSNDIGKVKDKSPNFTLIVDCALYDSMAMALARLYDKSNQACTITALIDSCLKNACIFSNCNDVVEKLNAFQRQLIEDKDLCDATDTLRNRRDYYYAHNDKKFFGAKGDKDKSYLPTYKLWALARYTEQVLVCLLTELSGQPLQQCKYNNDLENSLK